MDAAGATGGGMGGQSNVEGVEVVYLQGYHKDRLRGKISCRVYSKRIHISGIVPSFLHLPAIPESTVGI